MTWIRTSSHQTSIPASPKRLKFVQVKTWHSEHLSSHGCIPPVHSNAEAVASGSVPWWQVSQPGNQRESTLNISELSFWMDSEVSGLFCCCFVAIAVPGFSLLSSLHRFCLEAFVAICLRLCRGLTNLAVKGCWTSQFLASKHFCVKISVSECHTHHISS